MYDNSLTIAVIAGTTRQNRKSIRAARYVAEYGTNLPNVQIVFVDPQDFKLPGDGDSEDSKDPRYSAITSRADAFFIVSPEYNYSFPGSLKRLLDSELDNYKHKPVALAGVSKGNWGGVRAVEALVPTVRRMGLVATSKSIYFPFVRENFDDHNQPIPSKKSAVDQSIKEAYEELIWLAKTLKHGRTHR